MHLIYQSLTEVHCPAGRAMDSRAELSSDGFLQVALKPVLSVFDHDGSPARRSSSAKS
jgi:hypothetical protein